MEYALCGGIFLFFVGLVIGIEFMNRPKLQRLKLTDAEAKKLLDILNSKDPVDPRMIKTLNNMIARAEPCKGMSRGTTRFSPKQRKAPESVPVSKDKKSRFNLNDLSNHLGIDLRGYKDPDEREKVKEEE